MRKEPKQGKYTSLKIDVETVARVTDWRRAQPDLPSSSDAIRRLIVIGLDAEGYPSDGIDNDPPELDEPVATTASPN